MGTTTRIQALGTKISTHAHGSKDQECSNVPSSARATSAVTASRSRDPTPIQVPVSSANMHFAPATAPRPHSTAHMTSRKTAQHSTDPAPIDADTRDPALHAHTGTRHPQTTPRPPQQAPAAEKRARRAHRRLTPRFPQHWDRPQKMAVEEAPSPPRPFLA